MPSQAIALIMPSVHSGRFLAASVSSIRSTNVPPLCSAKAQLNRTDRALPTWNMPVGDGAKRTLIADPELFTAAESSPAPAGASGDNEYEHDRRCHAEGGHRPAQPEPLSEQADRKRAEAAGQRGGP